MATRKIIDCRRFPSEKNCSLAVSGTEEEVLDLAVLHATAVHRHENTPELREQIRSLLQDAITAAAAEFQCERARARRLESRTNELLFRILQGPCLSRIPPCYAD